MNTTAKIVARPDLSTKRKQSIFSATVSAGFPSPAADYEEGKLDLNRHLIKNPPATFFVRVTGDSMVGAGIHSDDLLIVDRSLEWAAEDGDIFRQVLVLNRHRYTLYTISR